MIEKIWTIICIIAGLICGIYASKYFELRYENELMTNFILRQEIREYRK
jgi:hypothetical protein